MHHEENIGKRGLNASKNGSGVKEQIRKYATVGAQRAAPLQEPSRCLCPSPTARPFPVRVVVLALAARAEPVVQAQLGDAAGVPCLRR